jgi:hypothetical protein
MKSLHQKSINVKRVSLLKKKKTSISSINDLHKTKVASIKEEYSQQLSILQKKQKEISDKYQEQIHSMEIHVEELKGKQGSSESLM